MFVCVLCGWDDPREVDGWLPGVGGVCLEHAAEAFAREISHNNHPSTEHP